LDYSFIIDNMVWSYSRVNSYATCPYSWYLNYILGEARRDSFYGEYGTLMHEKIAELYSGEKSKEEVLFEYMGEFHKKVFSPSFALKDYNATKEKYFNIGADYIENFKPLEHSKILEIEKQSSFKIKDYNFTAIIDLVLKQDNGDIIIVDHKSTDIKPRSKRGKVTQGDLELEEYLKQLYVYSIPIYNEYGKYPSKLCFNCFKSGVLIEEEFDKQKLDNTIDWIYATIDRIKAEKEWKPVITYMFCKDLCSARGICEYVNKG
jgi:hypothetical protein